MSHASISAVAGLVDTAPDWTSASVEARAGTILTVRLDAIERRHKGRPLAARCLRLPDGLLCGYRRPARWRERGDQLCSGGLGSEMGAKTASCG